MTEHYLDLTQIAQRAGITIETARIYNKRARANRRAGTPKPGDLPEPDIYIGDPARRPMPGWHKTTIDTWLKHRTHRGRPKQPR